MIQLPNHNCAWLFPATHWLNGVFPGSHCTHLCTQSTLVRSGTSRYNPSDKVQLDRPVDTTKPPLVLILQRFHLKPLPWALAILAPAWKRKIQPLSCSSNAEESQKRRDTYTEPRTKRDQVFAWLCPAGFRASAHQRACIIMHNYMCHGQNVVWACLP
jgi:hypothetical protein